MLPVPDIPKTMAFSLDDSPTDVPYLFRLGSQLAHGLRWLPEDSRRRHRDFVLSRQQSDGGFAGRDDESDLYYTGFAVRALAILDGLEPDQIESISRYISAHRHDRMPVIDLLSWLYTALVVQSAGGPNVPGLAADSFADRAATMLEATRTADGGYAKTVDGAAGSTYHSFLVTVTRELIGRGVPRPNALVRFLIDRQRDDGGFVEIAPMKRSGTNPTAAAAALLMHFDALDDRLRDEIVGFLCNVRSDEGGFQANTRIPFADGLSSFTGLLTAQHIGAPGILDERRLTDFVRGQLELPGGGFRGASWDEQADVEYTFYGLGILALLGAGDHPVVQVPRSD